MMKFSKIEIGLLSMVVILLLFQLVNIIHINRLEVLVFIQDRTLTDCRNNAELLFNFSKKMTDAYIGEYNHQSQNMLGNCVMDCNNFGVSDKISCTSYCKDKYRIMASP